MAAMSLSAPRLWLSADNLFRFDCHRPASLPIAASHSRSTKSNTKFRAFSHRAPSHPGPWLQPTAAGARILLLPRQLVAGERSTLAVLDVNGRLTPNVAVSFSNGDHLKTDATGRALFVAPLTTGVIFGSIDGRAGRVTSTVLTAAQANPAISKS